MLLDLKVSKSVIIDVNAKKVWSVLTTPEYIKQFFYGTETITDWLVGSEIVFQGEYQDMQYRDHGIIMEDKPGNYSIITYSLKNIAIYETEFTWSQHGFANHEGYQHSETGLEKLLNTIKKIAEGLK